MRARRARARNVCAALARHEISGGSSTALPALSVARWPLARVLDAAERLVLLGFSADGHFLLYYAWRDAAVELQWRRADFAERRAQEPPALRLRVALAASSPVDTLAPLHVWQSGDRALVAAFAATEGSGAVCVTLSPSPSRAAHASAVRSVHFAFGGAALPQQRPWQLLQLFPRECGAAHHLVLHKGAAVLVLVFALVEQTNLAGGAAAEKQASGRQLGVHRFGQNAWYAASEFPLAVESDVCHRRQQFDGDGSVTVGVECVSQQTFDVEAFLRAFLDKYPALRSRHLVDYDLQLVQVSVGERALFMSCVFALEAQPPARVTMALCFSLDVVTGECTVVRALQQPRHADLPSASRALASAFRADVARRVVPPPPDCETSAWSNAAVAREQPLERLDNPRFPVAIVR